MQCSHLPVQVPASRVVLEHLATWLRVRLLQPQLLAAEGPQKQSSSKKGCRLPIPHSINAARQGWDHRLSLG